MRLSEHVISKMRWECTAEKEAYDGELLVKPIIGEADC